MTIPVLWPNGFGFVVRFNKYLPPTLFYVKRTEPQSAQGKNLSKRRFKDLRLCKSNYIINVSLTKYKYNLWDFLEGPKYIIQMPPAPTTL